MSDGIQKETSTYGLDYEVDKTVEAGDLITPQEIKDALIKLKTFVAHTHTYEDTYDTNCNCNCNCSRGLL